MTDEPTTHESNPPRWRPIAVAVAVAMAAVGAWRLRTAFDDGRELDYATGLVLIVGAAIVLTAVATVPRKRWRLLSAVSVALLAVGAGAWIVPGRSLPHPTTDGSTRLTGIGAVQSTVVFDTNRVAVHFASGMTTLNDLNDLSDGEIIDSWGLGPTDVVALDPDHQRVDLVDGGGTVTASDSAGSELWETDVLDDDTWGAVVPLSAHAGGGLIVAVPTAPAVGSDRWEAVALTGDGAEQWRVELPDRAAPYRTLRLGQTMHLPAIALVLEISDTDQAVGGGSSSPTPASSSPWAASTISFRRAPRR